MVLHFHDDKHKVLETNSNRMLKIKNGRTLRETLNLRPIKHQIIYLFHGIFKSTVVTFPPDKPQKRKTHFHPYIFTRFSLWSLTFFFIAFSP